MVLAEAGKISHLFQRQILGKVFIDIVGDIEKLVQIVLLTAVGCIGYRMFQSSVKPSDIHQNAHESGVNGSLIIRFTQEIFFFDFQHQLLRNRMKVRKFLLGNQHGGAEQGDQKIQLTDLDLGQGWLKNNTFSTFRRKKLMDDAWTDKQNISFPQFIMLFANNYGIAVFYRHNHFKRRVPVRRVIFIFIVIIQADLCIGTVICRFVDATEMVDHMYPLLYNFEIKNCFNLFY